MNKKYYKKPIEISKAKQPISRVFRSTLLHGRKMTLKQVLAKGKKVGQFSGTNNIQPDYLPLYYYKYEDDIYLADIILRFICTAEQFKIKKPRFFKEI